MLWSKIVLLYTKNFAFKFCDVYLLYFILEAQAVAIITKEDEDTSWERKYITINRFTHKKVW